MILDLYKIHHNIPDNEKNIIHALYCDILELNNIIENNLGEDKCLHLHYQDWHDEYSEERVDPCPDYYGTYSLINDNGDRIGINMDIDTLDTVLCSLTDLMEHLYK